MSRKTAIVDLLYSQGFYTQAEEVSKMSEFTANLELVAESQRRDDDAIYDRRTETELVEAVKQHCKATHDALFGPFTFNGAA
jgi:hypothetical protein